MSSYMIPSVVERTVRGERAVDIYSRLLTDRIVYIGTEIDDGVANVVIAQLLHLESDDPGAADQPLPQPPRRLASPRCWPIYDTMQFIRPEVGTTCVGQAASSAAVLLAAGEPGRRLVLPHSRAVLHQPSGGGQGTLPDLALQAKEIVRLRAEMERVLVAPHRPHGGAAARGHRPRPGAAAPRPRWPTGWPTRCSTAASRPPSSAAGTRGGPAVQPVEGGDVGVRRAAGRAAARFSSRWATELVPGISRMLGERCSSQASATWRPVASYCRRDLVELGQVERAEAAEREVGHVVDALLGERRRPGASSSRCAML